MRNPVFTYVEDLNKEIEKTQHEAIEQVAKEIIKCIDGGGILQAWGSGHSLAGAMEICHRAGGFIPTKRINEPSMGQYETVEGVGKTFMKKVDIRKGDLVFVISNSGINPLGIEIAMAAKEKGAKVVAITALEASKTLKAKHSSNKKLYEIADHVLDNRTPLGDCCIELAGLPSKVIGLSMITTSIIIQSTMYRAMQMMIEEGKEPKVYQSQNIEGMRERNEELEKAYADRLNRI